MAKERLYIFDTTLRDGAQTNGVDFSVSDKRRIAAALDTLGVDYVEGGWPGANPTDTEFFAAPPSLGRATFTAFGMTKRAGRSVSNDPGLAMVLDAATPAVCLVGKSWDYQVDVALGVPRADNVEAIRDSMAAIVARGAEAMFDAEHFFDGYKANPDYALECLLAAHEAGARWLVLCDTNGGSLPHEVHETVSAVVQHIPGDRIGIHTHNDTENAVANTLAAIDAGARQAQGTLNGLGERCGNANLCSLLPALLLKPGYKDRFETGVTAAALTTLTQVSRLVDEILNRNPNRHQPYVGASAFAHKGGLHVSAVQKAPQTYEHVPPESVGNERIIPVSGQSGRSNILALLSAAGMTVAGDDSRVPVLLSEVKEREYNGFAYDGAGASFELLARRAFGQLPSYFEIERFRVSIERRYNAKGELVITADAMVKVTVNGEVLLSAAESDSGPVHALDLALRKDLGHYNQYIEDLTLEDYKVRILQGGSEAVTRVLIDWKDNKGRRWSTIGVSNNIVDASFQALIDAIIYKLFKEGAPAANALSAAGPIRAAGE